MAFKIRGGQKKIHISVENIADWIANRNLPWEEYRIFISGCLIELNKQPGVCPVLFG